MYKSSNVFRNSFLYFHKFPTIALHWKLCTKVKEWEKCNTHVSYKLSNQFKHRSSERGILIKELFSVAIPSYIVERQVIISGTLINLSFCALRPCWSKALIALFILTKSTRERKRNKLFLDSTPNLYIILKEAFLLTTHSFLNCSKFHCCSIGWVSDVIQFG